MLPRMESDIYSKVPLAVFYTIVRGWKQYTGLSIG